MNTVFTVTTLFSLLLSFARSPASLDLERTVSTREMQLVLTAFEVDGPGLTKQEADFARAALFNARRSLTPEAQSTADLWLARSSSAVSGKSLHVRRVEAFRLTSTWVRGMRGSQRLTEGDVGLLLAILGSKPNPVRAYELSQWASRAPLTSEAKVVVERWIARGSRDYGENAAVKALTPAVEGLQWMSESDFPIGVVCFPKSPLWPFTKAQMQKQIGEPPAVPSAVRSVNQLFGWVSTALASSDPDERARAKRFDTLRSILEENLKSLRAYSFGEIDQDLLILGESKQGRICGLVTRVVET
jgi:hypothetical protein